MQCLGYLTVFIHFENILFTWLICVTHPELPLLHMVSMVVIDNTSEIDYCAPNQSQNPCPQSAPGSNWQFMRYHMR